MGSPPTAALRHQGRSGWGVSTLGRPSAQNPAFIPPPVSAGL